MPNAYMECSFVTRKSKKPVTVRNFDGM